MRIGGFQRASLIDYPGEIGAVVFCQGCNFRCPYCHNPELVDPGRFSAAIPEDQIFSFLARRVGKLDAVTVTGGEPTLQDDLFSFLSWLKDKGYLVKLDTNGSMPSVLERLIAGKKVDYLAMDLKGPLEKYPEITGVSGFSGAVADSICLIMASGLKYEFRTTVVDALLSEADLLAMGGLISKARRYVLQPYVASKVLDPAMLNAKSLPLKSLEKIRSELERKIESVTIR